MATISDELISHYGLEEAYFICKLASYIKYHKENNRNFHDGRTWNRSTHKDFAESFATEWSSKKVERIQKSLIDKGVLVKNVLNKTTYDRTTSLAFVDEENILKMHGHRAKNVERVHSSKMTNRNDKTDESKVTKLSNRKDTGDVTIPIRYNNPVHNPVRKKRERGETHTQPVKSPFEFQYTKTQIEIAQRKKIDIDFEFRKFKDYWTAAELPKKFFGSRRFSTWLSNARPEQLNGGNHHARRETPQQQHNSTIERLKDPEYAREVLERVKVRFRR